MSHATPWAVTLATVLIVCAAGGANAADFFSKATVTTTGLQIETATGVLSLEPWADNIIHVRFAANPNWSNPYNSWVISKPARVRWTVDELPDSWVLKTSEIRARVLKRDGALSFLDKGGTALLSEGAAARGLSPGGVGPVVQAFDPVSPLYGLGAVRVSASRRRGRHCRCARQECCQSSRCAKSRPCRGFAPRVDRRRS